MSRSHTSKWRSQAIWFLSPSFYLLPLIPCVLRGVPSFRLAVATGVHRALCTMGPAISCCLALGKFPHFREPISVPQRELLIVKPAPVSSDVFNVWLPYPITTSLCPSPCLSICLWTKTQNWFHSSIQEPSLARGLWLRVPLPPSWGVRPAVASGLADLPLLVHGVLHWGVEFHKSVKSDWKAISLFC